jgi:hypothetical protein
MPVLIVDNNSATSIKDGTIQIGDLQNMTDEYKSHVSLTPIPPRNVVIKRNSFYFTKDQVQELFDHYEDNPNADAIEIAIGIQIPGSKVTCSEVEKDNSNCLAVIISMANKTSLNPINEIDDYVLINGYQPANPFQGTEICCPGSKPPPPES